jgi:Arc/MetJ-type ribon-helix-helix transcriptional regulator
LASLVIALPPGATIGRDQAGERSGTSTPFDFDAFLDRKRAEASRGR